ncbi:hypothetical protein [Bacillus sp. EB01]|jgi:hypothetical protein|uniref:hypothetical protein n=1 Tax=Bacillus sp. EB01 TaxID=1347086 RepID=UPI0005C67E70|nr:hypothetical protein [Bacillus sp. EB01]
MAVKTKKVNFSIPLTNGKVREITGGLEFKLNTGHAAVVHPSIKGNGWSVTLKDTGLLMIKDAANKDEAIDLALEESDKLGKEFIANRIKRFKKEGK